MRTLIKIHATVIRKKSPIRMRCMCCSPQGQLNGNIAEGDEYFFIERYRTFRKLGLQKRDPIIKHRLCSSCIKKVFTFLGITNSATALEIDKEYVISSEYSMKKHCSTMEYDCMCCRVEIPKNEAYCRRGAHTTVCLNCMKVVEGVVGNEYS